MRTLIAILFFFVSYTANASGLEGSISKVPDDINCSMALALAERVTIEQMPNDLSHDEVNWKLVSEHRLVGLWFADDSSCEVYDIMSLKKGDDRRSPHEILEEDILERMVRDGAISRYEAEKNGAFFRLYE